MLHFGELLTASSWTVLSSREVAQDCLLRSPNPKSRAGGYAAPNYTDPLALEIGGTHAHEAHDNMLVGHDQR